MSQSTWQGALRSQAFEQKDSSMMNKKPTRNALGDISNRTRSKTGQEPGWKKSGSSKPFAIAQTNSKASRPASQSDSPQKQRLFSNPQEPIDEIDKHDLGVPKYAAEYVADIYKYYKDIECRSVPAPDYMSKQTDINEKMRALLIDWLCQVHNKFELVPATLYLTVSLLDRFLEKKIVSRRKLQLVGCACMLLGSKYEEIYAPELNDFVGMSDNAFTSEDLLRMEGVILNVLKFNLTVPTVYKFLRRYLKVLGASVKIQHHATYIVERTLQEYSVLKFMPSTVAASALMLALRADNCEDDWDDIMERNTRYTPADLQECCQELVNVIRKGESSYLQAVNKKYASSKYMNASSIHLE
uniref:Cyclin N-terminal domain-containing protein n=2 Tax=Aplanochytrium stocchinoi TaxID=215587 RepID=A0A7S3PF66_9STRA|mmetsp:Transcript_7907/g.8952  ORF Transcript_7907/g.8952 Transcript_7907/m.8952 type:complete len:356 (+) Transcript_7907:287-1354(+)|eukprot:CAMPEP_0204872502 /NCGR_PEP_ID=MMETSP1348-20121228/38354_1 /ASSEMBLY_ACC=CAM_ASM_000700 /TAXON_ID=215587 /ORGANISM="Aplanochytrium stocchinoi, Strain GSBS06" /LENGTH=355 /DNA_ID=CAMNT_0052027395 /DNA_START=285 /DNA_END=1352 /DNA_ORIENTATION=+